MMFRLFNRPVWRRIFNRIDVEHGPISLDRQRIFILPTRHGLMFAVVLLLMLIGSINYSLSLGFVLTFLLGGMALVSILHTYRNLAQLTVNAGKTMPVFAGQQASFTLCLTSSSTAERYAVGVMLEKQHPQFVDIPAGESVTTSLARHAQQRGAAEQGDARVHVGLGVRPRQHRQRAAHRQADRAALVGELDRPVAGLLTRPERGGTADRDEAHARNLTGGTDTESRRGARRQPLASYP